MEEIKTIQDKINELRRAESPDVIADLRIELASWKAWVGVKLVDSEIAYNVSLNEEMNVNNLPAVKAEIVVKAKEVYKTYAQFRQLYKDIQTVISAAKTKLMVLSDERREM